MDKKKVNKSDTLTSRQEEQPVSTGGKSSNINNLPRDVISKTKKTTRSAEQRTTTQPVKYDPIQAYIQKIYSYPKLSADEEQKLAIKYQQDQDLKSAYQLIKANLWLVLKISRQYERMAKNLMDLVQEGNIGLMEAVKNFDPHKGVRLPTYATWWIKAYIIKYILANWRLVKIGTTQAQKKLFFNLNKEKKRLEREGFNPNPKLIAQNLNVKESEVIEMEQRLASADLSVDAPLNSDQNDDFHSILPDQKPTAENLVAEKEIKELLEKAIAEFKETLKPRQIVIFEKRLLSDQKITLKEIAEELEVSIEAIRQSENKIKDSFRSFLNDHYESIVQYSDDID